MSRPAWTVRPLQASDRAGWEPLARAYKAFYVTEHDAANFRYGATYLDVARTEDLVFIQITANDTRTVEQKKALFQRIAQLLGEAPGIRPEDVFVNLVEVRKENWSLGNGLAQYA